MMAAIAIGVASGAVSGALAASLLWWWMAKRMEFAAAMTGANFILTEKKVSTMAESLLEALQVVRQLEADVAEGAQLISTLFAVTESEKTLADAEVAQIKARLREIEDGAGVRK